MEIIARLANLPGALPGACAQGLIWGIMAIGVYLTYRILDVADLTVDGSFGTGGAVCVMCLLSGMNVWAALLVAVLAGLATGLVTGLLHTFMGIPAILAGILTQLALYSINLKIMGKANQSINVDKYDLLIGMDSANLRNMYRICGGDFAGKLHLLMDYTDHPGDVADPWYTDDFEETWRDVLEGCQGLLDSIIRKEE